MESVIPFSCKHLQRTPLVVVADLTRLMEATPFSGVLFPLAPSGAPHVPGVLGARPVRPTAPQSLNTPLPRSADHRAHHQRFFSLAVHPAHVLAHHTQHSSALPADTAVAPFLLLRSLVGRKTLEAIPEHDVQVAVVAQFERFTAHAPSCPRSHIAHLLSDRSRLRHTFARASEAFSPRSSHTEGIPPAVPSARSCLAVRVPKRRQRGARPDACHAHSPETASRISINHQLDRLSPSPRFSAPNLCSNHRSVKTADHLR